MGTPPLLSGTIPGAPCATSSKIPYEAAPEPHFTQNNEINWLQFYSFYLQSCEPHFPTISPVWPVSQWNGHKHLSVLLRAADEKGVENSQHMHGLLCLFPAGIFWCSFLDKPVWAPCTLRGYWATFLWLMVRRSAPEALQKQPVSRWNRAVTPPCTGSWEGQGRLCQPGMTSWCLPQSWLCSPSLLLWLMGNDKPISPFLTILFLLLLGRAAPSGLSQGSHHWATPCPKQSSSEAWIHWTGISQEHQSQQNHPTSALTLLQPSQSLCWGGKSHIGMPQHRPSNPARPTHQQRQAGGSTNQEKMKVAENALIPSTRSQVGVFSCQDKWPLTPAPCRVSHGGDRLGPAQCQEASVDGDQSNWDLSLWCTVFGFVVTDLFQ